MNSFSIHNCKAVLPHGVLEDAVVRVEDGVVAGISQGESAGRGVDAGGTWLLPGFVDMHSDAIEKAIEPRPGARFPTEIGVRELDRCLAAWGVTTIYHSLSFAEMEQGLRSNAFAASLIDQIVELAPRLRVDTRIHARFEVTDLEAVPHLERLLDQGRIELLSFMDHSPGQGQYRDEDAYRAYYGKVYGLTTEKLDQILDRKRRAIEEGVIGAVEAMAAICRSRGVAMASHDDDSPRKIEWCVSHGVSMSEFPVDLDTARHARDAGLVSCLGAPNLVRGGSQAGNMSVRTAIEAGLGDVLCSDYLPQSLLHAVFLLPSWGVMPIEKAVAMASSAPAKALGIADRVGSIREGLSADLILVADRHGLPDIVRTWSRGREVYRSC
ncbi:MAG: phosphonate metabolism protein PhnM [Fibrobacteria bacterium]|nr:phosphonate metabolism protein PhnM [Fibrobacteria bacterium]